MNSYVGKGHRGANWAARYRERGAGELGKIDVHLGEGGAADGDGDSMSTRFARVGLPGRMILIVCVTVMVPISCWGIVIVRGRPVVVIWVIVADVFVDVQRRGHGHRHDQGLSKQECDEPAHGSSLLRPDGHRRGGVLPRREWIGLGLWRAEWREFADPQRSNARSVEIIWSISSC